MSKRMKTRMAMKNSRNASKYDYNYSSGGRVYQIRDEAHPLPLRSDVIRHNAYNEQMSANDLLAIESLFDEKLGDIKYRRNINRKGWQEIRERIISEYDLHLINNNRYVGDPEYVYSVLVNKFPKAAEYKDFTKILYRVRYGESKVLARYKASTGEKIE